MNLVAVTEHSMGCGPQFVSLLHCGPSQSKGNPYVQFSANLNSRQVELKIQLDEAKGLNLEVQDGSLFEGAYHEEDVPKVGQAGVRLAKLHIKFPKEHKALPEPAG